MIMLILMTAALAAAQPAAAPPADADPHAHHMAQPGMHAQKDCCDCCKDMAGKHEGHAEHDGHAGQ
jgi:hypothetical protein